MSNKYQIPDLQKKEFDWQSIFTGAFVLIVLFIVAMIGNIGGTRSYLCTRDWFRPVCAATNLSFFRFSREDVVWYEASEAKSCAGIEQYLAKYPNGKNAQLATARLSGRALVEQADWQEKQTEVDIHYTRFLNQYLVKPNPAPSLSRAKHDAVENAHAEALEVACLPFKNGNFKLDRARIKPQNWNCTIEGTGHACDFDGTVTCNYSEKSINFAEQC